MCKPQSGPYTVRKRSKSESKEKQAKEKEKQITEDKGQMTAKIWQPRSKLHSAQFRRGGAKEAISYLLRQVHSCDYPAATRLVPDTKLNSLSLKKHVSTPWNCWVYRDTLTTPQLSDTPPVPGGRRELHRSLWCQPYTYTSTLWKSTPSQFRWF